MNKSHAITARNEKLLSDVYVSYFANGDYPRHIARPMKSNGQLIKPDLKLKSMLENFPYNWSVIMCVFTIENGKPSIEMEIGEPKGRCRQDDMLVDLNYKHGIYAKKIERKN